MLYSVYSGLRILVCFHSAFKKADDIVQKMFLKCAHSFSTNKFESFYIANRITYNCFTFIADSFFFNFCATKSNVECFCGMFVCCFADKQIAPSKIYYCNVHADRYEMLKCSTKLEESTNKNQSIAYA